MQFDMDGIAHSLVTRQGDAAQAAKLNETAGYMLSALEHEIAEAYLTSNAHPAEAFSAVKALALALEQGQAIYHIDASNLDTVLNAINQSAGVEADIRTAVLSGAEAIVSETPVSVPGWSGAGYIIVDPLTGAGAYRISGGADGSEMAHSDIAKGLTMLGLGLIVRYIPPLVSADIGQCGEEDNVQVPWGLVLAAAIALALIALIASRVPPVLGPALAFLILVVSAVNRAQADESGGCPVYISGQITSRGKAMNEVTAHIADAVGGSSPNMLTFQPKFVERSGWYNSYPECKEPARQAFAVMNGEPGACDEYPFFQTLEGGPINYGPPNGFVSLRLIRLSHNNAQGGTLNRFYYGGCGMSTGMRFEVQADPAGMTRALDRHGVQCYPAPLGP